MAVRVANIANLPRALRNIGRVGEILGISAKYGMGDIFGRLGLTSALSDVKTFFWGYRGESAEIAKLKTEQRIRLMLEDLGPTFVKLGQVLATRPDLIPASLIEELKKLQDKVPPFPAAMAREMLQKEYGRPVDEVFAEFEDEHLAAASIAQVHRARLKDGPRVILKVRRPGIERTIDNDLDILESLAELAEERVPEARRFNPVGIVAEFRKSIIKEIDLTHEARNIKRYARNFEGDDTVHVPEVFEEFTTPAVLCEELIEGVKMSSGAIKERTDLDLRTVAENGISIILRQTLVHGFFHADPHPGNIFVMDGNKICMIDFGMMGTLTQERIDDILSFLVAILTKNVDKLIRILSRLDLLHDRVNLRALRREVAEMIDEYYSVELATVDIGKYLQELIDVINAHEIILPADLLLVGKSLATIEGVARDIYPELDPVAAIRPFILKIYLSRLTDPSYFAREPMRLADDTVDLLQALPREARSIIRRLGAGELDVGIQVRGLEEALKDRAQSQNRMSLAIVIASSWLGATYLIVNSQLVNAGLFGVTLPLLLGLLAIGVVFLYGLVLFVGFFRSGGV